MTREEFESSRLRLMFSGICPACGSPIDLEGVRKLLLRCTNPACNFSYQAALHERFEVSGAPDDRPGSARLPLRES